MTKNNALAEFGRALTRGGRSILSQLAEVLLPQPTPEYRPIPIRSDDRRR